jgi:type IV pilus assembly protein PilA
MFCALCAADNPNDGRFCVKCGAVLQGQKGMPPPGLGFDVPAPPYSGPTESSGKAIGSLICGILFFFFPSAIVAIILGHLSLSDIRKAGGRLTGRGMATAGLVLGYGGIAVLPIVLIVAAIAIPNLLRARMAANEASAVGSVRTIETAAFLYDSAYSNGFPPSLAAMDGRGGGSRSCDHAQMIESILASGQKSGYVFTYVALPAMADSQPPDSQKAAANGCTVRGGTTFTVNADPITRGTTGQRSFFANQTGVIRSDTDGPASADSKPIR